jgi:hypothetical protein
METGAPDGGAARFLDEQDRDRGSAGMVTRRVKGLSSLTVLDVSAPDPSLVTFLTTLDRSRLSVQHTPPSEESYTFAWASGYANGSKIRIQGVLETGALATPRRRRS